MTKEEMSRIGTPFYTLKNSGTGIGLMVSYKFIQLLNGKVRVESEKGKQKVKRRWPKLSPFRIVFE